MAEKSQSLTDRLIPTIMVGIIGLAFAVGMLWQKVSYIENGGITANVAGAVANDPEPVAPTTGKLDDAQAEKVAKVSSFDYAKKDTLIESSSGDHIKGNPNAKVSIVEYSDLECPYCGRFHPTAQQALDENNGDVNWVYRHFPLDSIHPYARPAAVASECAAQQQGDTGFWAFIDAAFADQTQLSDLESIASGIGLNMAQFTTCVDGEAAADIVEENYQSGLSAGVTGTPGNFVINNETGEVWVLPGAVPIESVQAAIDSALAS